SHEDASAAAIHARKVMPLEIQRAGMNALEDDLAVIAAEDDLHGPPPDRVRVPRAHRAGRLLGLVGRRQGIDGDLEAASTARHQLARANNSVSGPSRSRSSECSSITSSAVMGGRSGV